MTDRTKVFISYSHKDEPWKDRLMSHLGVLEFQDLLHIWVDTRINAGENWRNSIEEVLNESKVAILLVTANFLTSAFILTEEVPRLLKKHAEAGMRIIPVIGKPCAWKVIPWLANIQVRPKEGRSISAGSDNQIDTDLMLITYEVALLINLIDNKTMGEQLASASLGYTNIQHQYIGSQSSGPQEYMAESFAAAAIDIACLEITNMAKLARNKSSAVRTEFVYKIIKLAISRGVPIYNSGSRIGCAQIYTYATKVVLDLLSRQPPSGPTSEARIIEVAKQTLEQLDVQSIPITPENADNRAWQIRHTFDSILNH